MRRSIVGAAGGFPPYRASEDLIFLETIQQRRWSIAYAPAAVAHWGKAAVALLRGRYRHLRSVNLAASVPSVLRPVSISR
jgi:hypothetical protein